ncbi:unnamed protein product [Paramecium sonneborni]|uniref:glycerol-3-phosphate dehydrogenase n=1 Tax=Paramecium sonneborni TaxID=65129 RepID=A0A8S1M195_9CILI|nr:unnamed protein product [Paramecium sonneborni]
MILGTTELKLDNATHDPAVSHEEYMWLLKSFRDQIDVDTIEVGRDVKSKWSGVGPLVSSSNTFTTNEISTQFLLSSQFLDFHPIQNILKEYLQDLLNLIFKFLLKHIIFMNIYISHRRQMDHFQIDGNIYRKIKNLPKLVGMGHNLIIKRNLSYDAMFDLPQSYDAYFIIIYGDRTYDVLKYIYENQKIRRVCNTIRQILYQIKYQQARKPQDILFSRIKLGFLAQNNAFQVYEKVFQIMVKELKYGLINFKSSFQKRILSRLEI